MLPTTITTIAMSGTTWIRKGRRRSRNGSISSSWAGASDGRIREIATMKRKNSAASSMPGTMPARSRREMEMPARLPNRTASAEGGISIATPPMPRIGPTLSTGW